MANGDTPWTWADHDRWIREVFIRHIQESDVTHHEIDKKQDKLETLILRIGIGIGGTLLALLGGVITNLIVLLHSAPHP